jgi:hypothetical protein
MRIPRFIAFVLLMAGSFAAGFVVGVEKTRDLTKLRLSHVRLVRDVDLQLDGVLENASRSEAIGHVRKGSIGSVFWTKDLPFGFLIDRRDGYVVHFTVAVEPDDVEVLDPPPMD